MSDMTTKYPVELIEVVDQFVNNLIERSKNVDFTVKSWDFPYIETYQDDKNPRHFYGWGEYKFTISNGMEIPSNIEISQKEMHNLVMERMRILYWDKVPVPNDF